MLANNLFTPDKLFSEAVTTFIFIFIFFLNAKTSTVFQTPSHSCISEQFELFFGHS